MEPHGRHCDSPYPRCTHRRRGAAVLVCAVLAVVTPARGQTSVNLNPAKDGTLTDGGTVPRDGFADQADWTFNGSQFPEGSILLADDPIPVEHRVIWEYNLAAVNYVPPIVARLQFVVRTAAIFPTPPTIPLLVASYPGDLMETLADFHMGPESTQGIVDVPASFPPPPPATFRVNVSDAINAALEGDANAAAFRFRIADTGDGMGKQLFIDASDADPATKPLLTVYDRLPGDFNADDAVSLTDAAALGSCLAGPHQPPPLGCSLPDDDFDGDIDLSDAAAFLNQFGATR